MGETLPTTPCWSSRCRFGIAPESTSGEIVRQSAPAQPSNRTRSAICVIGRPVVARQFFRVESRLRGSYTCPMSARLAIHIRAAHPDEMPAGPMLLPRAFRESRDLSLWVAVVNDPTRIVGAAVLEPYISFADPGGYRGDFHVVPPFRRRGIGRALADVLAKNTQSADVGALYAWQPIQERCEASFLEHCGFRVQQRLTTYRVQLQEFCARISRIATRVAKSGRVPATAQIVPLDQAPIEQIVKLHVEHLGGCRELIAPRVRGEGPMAFSPELSQVMMQGGRVVAAVLAHRDRDTAVTDARIVHPAFRGSWANAVLMNASAVNALAQGCTDLEFGSSDSNSDTLKLAARTGARIVNRTELFARLLD